MYPGTCSPPWGLAVKTQLRRRGRNFRTPDGVRRHNMPRTKDDLKARLSRYRQITIGVIGRKSGRTISIPVWFVLEGEKLYLLPVQGSDTQWYKNVSENPRLRISARGEEGDFEAAPVTEA